MIFQIGGDLGTAGIFSLYSGKYGVCFVLFLSYLLFFWQQSKKKRTYNSPKCIYGTPAAPATWNKYCPCCNVSHIGSYRFNNPSTLCKKSKYLGFTAQCMRRAMWAGQGPMHSIVDLRQSTYVSPPSLGFLYTNVNAVT